MNKMSINDLKSAAKEAEQNKDSRLMREIAQELIAQDSNKNFTEIVKWYLKAIKERDYDAAIELANFYRDMNMTIMAEKYYRLAAPYSDVAMFNLGNLFFNLDDERGVVRWFGPLAEKNDKDAIYNIGLFYKNHNRNNEAQKWLKKGYELGDAEAGSRLGDLSQDYESKEDWYLKAVDQGDVQAMLDLADLYYDNEKYVEAEEMYRKAIANGRTEYGNLRLGTMLWLKYDDRMEEALNYLEQSAEENNGMAFYTLGEIYEDAEEYGTAKEYFQQASINGHPHAYVRIGNIEENLGHSSNAIHAYEKAIDEEEYEALKFLGRIYLNDNQFEQAKLLLNDYFRLADIDEFDVLTKIQLGEAYLDTNEIDNSLNIFNEVYDYYQQNPEDLTDNELMYLLFDLGAGYTEKENYSEAIRWFEECANEFNEDEAMNRMGIIYSNFLNEPRKGEKWFLKSAENGSMYACSNLGDYYFNKRQYQLAYQWYDKAVQRGLEDAKKNRQEALNMMNNRR